MVKRFDASIAKFGVDKAEKELGSLEDADGGIQGAKGHGGRGRNADRVSAAMTRGKLKSLAPTDLQGTVQMINERMRAKKEKRENIPTVTIKFIFSFGRCLIEIRKDENKNDSLKLLMKQRNKKDKNSFDDKSEKSQEQVDPEDADTEQKIINEGMIVLFHQTGNLS